MALFLNISSGCGAHVKIKDSIWLGSLGRDGAAEFHTLKTDKRHVPFAEFKRMWEDLSHPMICTYAETFADWKAVQQKLCSWAPERCTYEDMQRLGQFFNKVQRYWKYVPADRIVAAYMREFPSDEATAAGIVELAPGSDLELEAPN